MLEYLPVISFSDSIIEWKFKYFTLFSQTMSDKFVFYQFNFKNNAQNVNLAIQIEWKFSFTVISFPDSIIE